MADAGCPSMVIPADAACHARYLPVTSAFADRCYRIPAPLRVSPATHAPSAGHHLQGEVHQQGRSCHGREEGVSHSHLERDRCQSDSDGARPSAPEILLNVIEVLGNSFNSGALGPSTIVGSAAFNLMVITAVCMVCLPAGEVRVIKQQAVFLTTPSTRSSCTSGCSSSSSSGRLR